MQGLAEASTAGAEAPGSSPAERQYRAGAVAYQGAVAHLGSQLRGSVSISKCLLGIGKGAFRQSKLIVGCPLPLYSFLVLLLHSCYLLLVALLQSQHLLQRLQQGHSVITWLVQLLQMCWLAK